VDGSEVLTLGYAQVRSLSLAGSDLLELTTADGIGLEWPLSGDSSWTAGTVRHLLWIGYVRSRIRSCRNDVELAAGEIRTRTDSREWDAATDTYEQVRARVDDICNLVFLTEPVDQELLAPELTEIERELERAQTRLYIERARSQMDLARHLVENSDYVQGRRVLGQAQAYYRRAQERSEAVRRGDAFQFGAQRSLTEDLQRLGWQIETVAAEPVKQAYEAKVKATTATETAEAIEHWERAFTRFGNVLTLEWGNDGRNFAGDSEKLRAEIELAADRLIDLHSAAGATRLHDAGRRRDDGEYKASLRACLGAEEHLTRAHELAEEFDPDRADEVATQLESVTDAASRMRTAVNTGHADAESAETDEQPPAESPSAPSGAGDISEMDTHFEITFDADALVDASEDGADDDPLESSAADKRADEKRRKNGNASGSGEQTHH